MIRSSFQPQYWLFIRTVFDKTIMNSLSCNSSIYMYVSYTILHTIILWLWHAMSIWYNRYGVKNDNSYFFSFPQNSTTRLYIYLKISLKSYIVQDWTEICWWKLFCLSYTWFLLHITTAKFIETKLFSLAVHRLAMHMYVFQHAYRYSKLIQLHVSCFIPLQLHFTMILLYPLLERKFPVPVIETSDTICLQNCLPSTNLARYWCLYLLHISVIYCDILIFFSCKYNVLR